MRPKKERKGSHLFWAEKFRKLGEIPQVHLKNKEKLGKLSGKLGKLGVRPKKRPHPFWA